MLHDSSSRGRGGADNCPQMTLQVDAPAPYFPSAFHLRTERPSTSGGEFSHASLLGFLNDFLDNFVSPRQPADINRSLDWSLALSLPVHPGRGVSPAAQEDLAYLKKTRGLYSLLRVVCFRLQRKPKPHKPQGPVSPTILN